MKKIICLLGITLFALSSCSKDKPDSKPVEKAIDKAVKPVAGFTANVTSVVAGGKVNFTDTSTNTPTSWTWTFEGGIPSSSTLQNPTNIAYATAGQYKVSLVATNTAGSSELVEIQKYITVTPVPNSNATLPKTLKFTNAAPANTTNYPSYTATFTYDGDKIKEITYDNGKKEVFTYNTGSNTISKMEEYNKNVLNYTTAYTYENNKLKSYINTDNSDYSYKVDYTYNPDGTISVVSTTTDKGTSTKLSSVYTLDKGNIVKIAYSDNNGAVDTFEYDTKNNPYKDISGYTLLLTSYNAFHRDTNSVNNITKTEKKDGNGQIKRTSTIGDNIYNAKDFLTKCVIKNSDDEITTYEYTY